MVPQSFVGNYTLLRVNSNRKNASCNPIRTHPFMLDNVPNRKGFGKEPTPPKNPSEGTKRRQAASERYDQMASAGMPEYTVWMRLREGGTADGEEMPWLPVGAISVPRSSQVSDALFEAEEDLMQGAIRLYPKLQNEPRENIQFGYQLRQFDDEPIRIAERSPKAGFQSMLANIFRKLQNPLNPPK